MERQEFEVLRARVETMERRMRMIVAGWVLSVAVLVVLGMAVQQVIAQPDVLRVRRIEVIDAARQPRITLDVTPDGSPELSLRDTVGRTRIMLNVFPDESSAVSLGDMVSRPRIALAVLPDGSPGISLVDATGQIRAILQAFPDGSPRLTLLDAAGRSLFRAP